MTFVLISAFNSNAGPAFLPKMYFGDQTPPILVGDVIPHVFGRLYIDRKFGPEQDEFKLALWNTDTPMNTLHQYFSETIIFHITIGNYIRGLGDLVAAFIVVMADYPRLYQSPDGSDQAIMLKFRDLLHHALWNGYSPRPLGLREATLQQHINSIVEGSVNIYLSSQGDIVRNKLGAFFQNICLVPNYGAYTVHMPQNIRPGTGMNVLLRAMQDYGAKALFLHMSAMNLNYAQHGAPGPRPHKGGIVTLYVNPYTKSANEAAAGGTTYLGRLRRFGAPEFDFAHTWRSPAVTGLMEANRIVAVDRSTSSFVLETRLNPHFELGLRYGFRDIRKKYPGFQQTWRGRVDAVNHRILESGVAISQVTLTNEKQFPWKYR